MFQEISFILNGKKRKFNIDVRKSLFEVLREYAGIKSVKQGCKVGECGACSVLVDDVLIDSCIFLGLWANGKKIKTLEGQAKQGKLSKVQQAYVDKGAIQCGFCTPGFVMATTSFVEKHKEKNVTIDEIKKNHAGNLCRCTGYQNILKAVKKSVEE